MTIAHPDVLAELQRREHKPMTLEALETALHGLGYRLDRSMDCLSIDRYMTGPHAGQTYPACNMYVREIDSGRSFAHCDSRRDDNFRTLQTWRREESHYAVYRNRIYQI